MLSIRVNSSWSFLIIGISILACQLPVSTFQTETETAPTPTEKIETLLPQSLYFLSDDGGDFDQVWRMEADGSAQSQITFEPDDVVDFDVSRVDGSVVYVVNNRLFWVDASGADRRLLVDGGEIENTDEYNYRRKIRKPLWSPDGSVVAFGQDGLVFYQLSSGTTSNPLHNEFRTLDEGLSIPTRILTPEVWSPDGMKLLYNIGYYEGSSVGVFNLSAAESIEFEDGPGCCFMAWSPDSQNFLMASPYLQYTEPGLWRYDANNGMATTLIKGNPAAGGYNLVSYPLETVAGELFFFYAELDQIPDGNIPMRMMRSSLEEPMAMVPMWNEAIPVYEVLWAEDGSLVLIVQPVGETLAYPYRGPVLRISFAENDSHHILVNGFNLRWGP